MGTTFVVLHEEKDGLWSKKEVNGVRTPESAIEKAALSPGKYVAMRKSMFAVKEVAPQTKYTVLASTPGGNK